MPFHRRSYLKLVSGSMNNEKDKNDIILDDIKMQCEYVAFPCKSTYLCRPVPAPEKSLMRYIAERDVTLLVG